MTERLNISEQEYRGLTMPSYSMLKKLDDSGPRSINRKYIFDSEAIDFGNLLDCRLLCPDEFNNKFYFEAVDKPTNQVLDLAEHILSLYGVSVLDLDNGDILGFADELKLFGAVKKVDKRIEQFDTPKFHNYLKVRVESLGKTIFTPDTLQECIEAEQILKTHPKTAHLFNLTKDQEAINQLMITTEVNGIAVKIMMDRLLIDHKEKTITPYDLKATEVRQVNFPYHFKKMKYYLQGGLYKLALINYCKDILQLGYEVKDFKFIVYSRSDRYPFVWNMGYNWHVKALNGFINEYGEAVKGIYELLDEYKFYVENDWYSIDKCLVENEYLEL